MVFAVMREYFLYHKVSVGEPEQGNERISCLNEGKRNKKRWFVALKGNNKRKRNIWKSPCTHTHLKKYLYCTTQTHTHEHHGNGRNKNIVRERERYRVGESLIHNGSYI